MSPISFHIQNVGRLSASLVVAQGVPLLLEDVYEETLLLHVLLLLRLHFDPVHALMWVRGKSYGRPRRIGLVDAWGHGLVKVLVARVHGDVLTTCCVVPPNVA